jgi:hypothetical protein
LRQIAWQIEICDVASEHRATIFGRCKKNQRIIERSTLLGLAASLHPRQESCEDAGIASSPHVWRVNAMPWP